MKSLRWYVGCVATVLAASVFYPRASFAVDCSYGGVFQPPLPFVGGVCIASGSLRSRGSLLLDPSSGWMFIEQGLKLSVVEEPQQNFPFVLLPGTLFIPPGGVLGTHQPVLNPVQITAAGAIINNGYALNLWAPTDPVIVRAAKGISFHGDPVIFDPSTFMLGDTVKVETTSGNISVDNASFVSVGDDADVSFVAPRGNITFTNTTIFVLKNGTEVGVCNFQVKKAGGSVTFGAGTGLVCFPKIKK